MPTEAPLLLVWTSLQRWPRDLYVDGLGFGGRLGRPTWEGLRATHSYFFDEISRVRVRPCRRPSFSSVAVSDKTSSDKPEILDPDTRSETEDRCKSTLPGVWLVSPILEQVLITLGPMSSTGWEQGKALCRAECVMALRRNNFALVENRTAAHAKVNKTSEPECGRQHRNGKRDAIHHHLLEATSETTNVLELRQQLLYTTPSGWWWWCIKSLFRRKLWIEISWVEGQQIAYWPSTTEIARWSSIIIQIWWHRKVWIKISWVEGHHIISYNIT